MKKNNITVVGIVTLALLVLVAVFASCEGAEKNAQIPNENLETSDTEKTEKNETPTSFDCTLEVNCESIIPNMDSLAENKRDVVPGDGIILPEATFSVEDGETVAELLVRVVKDKKIQIQLSDTALTGGTYIESIGNIYNSDCGAMSGWLFSVNGKFPSEGVSDFVLSEGDAVRFLFTCDGGPDVGAVFE